MFSNLYSLKQRVEESSCWLDVSGLALYFFNRIVERGLGNSLPSAVFERLQLNLIDNTERTRGMISESIAIQQEFQNDGLCYALLKGLSLWPESVQQPELRLQFDLDFLVDEISLPRARKIIEDRGYRLYAAKGRSWEFKLNQQPGISLNDIYKHVSSFTVELHVQPNVSNDSSPLKRLQWRELRGMRYACSRTCGSVSWSGPSRVQTSLRGILARVAYA